MKNKRKTSIIVIAVLALILIATAFILTRPKTPKDTVRTAYHALNNKENDNGTKYLEVNLPEDHVFKEKSNEDITNLLTKGTGVIFFGFEECPYCRNGIEVIDEVAKKLHLDEVTYLNIRDLRDRKVLKDNEVITTKEADPFYTELLTLLGDDAPVYQGLNDPTIKRIPAPFVVVIVDGVIIDTHMGIVPTDDPSQPLDKEQRRALSKIYEDMFLKIPGCYLGTADVCY